MLTNKQFLRLVRVGLLASLVCAGAAHADDWYDSRPYSALYVFGDSLSDTGNRLADNGPNDGPGADGVIGEPNPNGRYSNGEIWIDVLARSLRTPRGALPASRSRWFGNYAYGGAQAEDGVNGGSVPDFGDQVTQFIANHRWGAPASALYVVEFGGNDLRRALLAAASGQPEQVPAIVQTSIAATIGNMNRLVERGARSFLVANVPSLGRVPLVQSLGFSNEAAALSALYNQQLAFNLAIYAEQVAPLGVQIDIVDFFGFLEIAADPISASGLGILETDQPLLFCGESCLGDNAYLFLDALHPTQAAHRFVGELARNAVRD